jgi:glycosyltransferase involved in cell wall biosynthesis
MRIAFYAPLKAPTHGTPSGDRRVAALYMDALALAGHSVELAATFRSFEPEGDASRQEALREQGSALARDLAARWSSAPREARPELWFTYHVYYKAPDWLGSEVSAQLGIPYVIAEASYAPKRAAGPWARGHEAAGAAIRAADLVLCPTRHDAEVLLRVAGARRLVELPPFLDPAPFRAAAEAREAHRARIAVAHGVDPALPWIAVAAMMRPGDKLASYRELAQALARVRDLGWRLLVAGGGSAQEQVRSALEAAVPGRTAYLGELALAEVAQAYAASDLCVWPAVNEAYGMAMLEAEAAGLPVVSCALRGVPDVIEHGRTGLLAPPGDGAALAALVRELLLDSDRCRAMGSAAARFVLQERSLEAAAVRLGAALARLAQRAAASAAA